MKDLSISIISNITKYKNKKSDNVKQRSNIDEIDNIICHTYILY